MDAARTAYPSAPVIRRERAHRRAVLLALATFLLLAASPLLARHLPLDLSGVVHAREHVWALCLVALHLVLAPVHGLFHLLLFAGLAYATWDRLRAWSLQRTALAALPRPNPHRDHSLLQAARLAGIDPDGLVVVPGMPNPAFTAGWLRPRVYVAEELTIRLLPRELTAVLAHEAAHVARRDPLRLSILRFLRCTLFWLPAVRALAEDIADETEIQADDRAAPLDPLSLASAILKLATWHPGHLATVGVGFHHRDLLDRRVRRLAGESVTPRTRLHPRSAIATVLGLALVSATGALMAHPLPAHAGHAAAHCEEHQSAPLSHLLCTDLSAARTQDDCPHRLAG
jgi:Zn-dependent protease with chaperone function